MKNAKLLGLAVVLMVAAAAVAGLIIAGSPAQERERRFDDQRTSDIQQIASAVDAYYASAGRLPATLDELVQPDKARLYYLRSITDPETGAPYEYTSMGNASYQLCAVFTQSSDDVAAASRAVPPVMMDPYAKAWEHPAGRHCFDLVSPPPMPGTICDIKRPCPVGQTCAMLPGATDAVCVAQGWECRAANCPDAACTIAESYPAQVRCTE